MKSEIDRQLEGSHKAMQQVQQCRKASQTLLALARHLDGYLEKTTEQPPAIEIAVVLPEGPVLSLGHLQELPTAFLESIVQALPVAAQYWQRELQSAITQLTVTVSQLELACVESEQPPLDPLTPRAHEISANQSGQGVQDPGQAPAGLQQPPPGTAGYRAPDPFGGLGAPGSPQVGPYSH